ncbi:PhaM family polyhydroxyalkanoate granule multifunctional regulatory protein [Castellaniella hirudinis]|uniref:PhaM family polyhydroxyalkanoate granule multifunctional regulatory protein n=1 Tax=Castellaniella hirudinis TaxID=1144617 RepID=UPI0039C2E0FA
MAQDKTNPFVLPGFGQAGDAAGNPLLAGLDMMRQAWQTLAGGGPLDAPAMPTLSAEDLDRRIRELQTVQNWLQLNATMLASTIQGLEIQRSTLQTLQSFAGGGFPGMAAAPGPAAAQPAQAAAAAKDSGQAYAQAASDWWNLVQQQFNQLRDATAASFEQVTEAAQQAAQQQAAEPAPEAAGAAKPAARKPRAAKPAAAKPAASSKKRGA